MTKETLNYLKEKTTDLLNAPSCCKELREAANAWLEAIGTEDEAAKTAEYIAEIEEDIMPIDGLIAFAGSEMGKKVFGEAAKNILAHAEEIKKNGGKYCDCPACTACKAILDKKADILA